MKTEYLEKLVDELDAAVFTGDDFMDGEERTEFRRLMARWERGLKEFDRQEELSEYHVTFYLMLQGMPYPDKRDYGIVLAKSEAKAKSMVAKRESPKKERSYFKGCLTAKKLNK